jgi:hypothetical protein
MKMYSKKMTMKPMKKGRKKTKTGGALGTTRPRTTRRTGGGGR